METLYKKDIKGKIVQWTGKVVQDQEGISLHISYGEYGGQIVSSVRRNIQGKNINKANETTPLEQGEAELASLIRRRKQLGYKSLSDLKFKDDNAAFGVGINVYSFLQTSLKYNTTDHNDNVKPMRCQQYYRSKKKWKDPYGKLWDDRKNFYLLNPDEPKELNAIIIKFPCLIQNKINGVRATISLTSEDKVQILSKEGLKYNLPHIEQAFRDNLDCFIGNEVVQNIVFDGELYIHNESLGNISSAVNGNNLHTARVEFLCFDLAVPDMEMLERIKFMKLLLDFTNRDLNCPIKIVKTYKVINDKHVQAKTDEFIAEGYEGSVLRDMKGTYMFGKRPMTMVKLKRLMDAEFKIIDVIPQDVNPDLGLYVCRTKEGKEFKVTPKGDTLFKQVVLATKSNIIGKQLTCTFYEYTEEGKPFHIVDNIIRDYE